MRSSNTIVQIMRRRPRDLSLQCASGAVGTRWIRLVVGKQVPTLAILGTWLFCVHRAMVLYSSQNLQPSIIALFFLFFPFFSFLFLFSDMFSFFFLSFLFSVLSNKLGGARRPNQEGEGKTAQPRSGEGDLPINKRGQPRRQGGVTKKRKKKKRE